MAFLSFIINNARDALYLGVLWSIMALGVYITFKVLDIADMTVDGSFAVGGCTAAVMVASGQDPFLAILVAIILGMAAGAVTGFLHTKLKIPAILAGILTMLSLYSINLKILNGKSNVAMPIMGSMKVDTVIDKTMRLTGLSTKNTNILFGVLIAATIVAVLYWFFGTELGSSIRATGNNEYMVRALGVNTDTMKVIGLTIANGLVAMSGAIVAQSQRYGDVGMGTGTIVIGLASIIIGEVVFGKNRSFWAKLISVVTGSVIYRLVIAIVLRMGMNPNDLKLLTAVIVGLSLSFPVIRKYIIMKKSAIANKRENQREAA